MKELESFFDAYKTAVFEKDVDAFISLYDKNILVFDTWQEWTYEGLAAWKVMVKGWFESLGEVRDAVTFDNIQIHDKGDMALLTAIAKFTAVSENGEELRYLQNRLTWVAAKNAGDWKIIHQHISSPIDFETMKVILKR
jgi:ketosteroid isomerase-like protein